MILHAEILPWSREAGHQVAPTDDRTPDREEHATPGPLPVVVLHGLLGASRNWRALARRWQAARSVVLIDLRNHGASPHAPSMAWEELTGDVAETVAGLGLSRVLLVGHSLGGKVALRLALDRPAVVAAVAVVDIVPKAYPPYHSRDFEAMLSLDLARCRSRQDADLALSEAVPDWAHRQFLLSALRREADGTLTWGIPLCWLYQNLDHLRQDSIPPLPFLGSAQPPVGPQRGSPTQPVLFLRGGRSRFITDEDQAATQARLPQARWQLFPEGSHNLQMDDPDSVAKVIEAFFQEAT